MDLVNDDMKKLGALISGACRHEPATTEPQRESRAMQLRAQALELLKQAEAEDGLQPRVVMHVHGFGHTTYICWSAAEPTEEQAVAILESSFEPESEGLLIGLPSRLEEIAGVHPRSRLVLPAGTPQSA